MLAASCRLVLRTATTCAASRPACGSRRDQPGGLAAVPDGAALICRRGGTLDVADLASQVAALSRGRLPAARGGQRAGPRLPHQGAMWPLSFWLPTTLRAASPPVAMLVLIAKVASTPCLRVSRSVRRQGGQAGFGLAGADRRRHGDPAARRGGPCFATRTAAGSQATAPIISSAPCWRCFATRQRGASPRAVLPPWLDPGDRGLHAADRAHQRVATPGRPCWRSPWRPRHEGQA